MPSRRPVKPSRSVVVALMLTDPAGIPNISATRDRMASRCGPILGASQMTVQSTKSIVPPASRSSWAAWARKMLLSAPFHCGSPGGKWLPMSPSAGCPQQGVGDGMEDDVGIAVAGQPAFMRYGNPADHDRPFAGKGMDVEPHSGAGNEPGAVPTPRRAAKSAAVVSFSSMGSPSTTATSRPAARSTVDSSVGLGPFHCA